MSTEVFVVLFQLEGLYEASNSDLIGVATSMERAKALAEAHFGDPKFFYRSSRGRTNDPRPLAWTTENGVTSAGLPWDKDYGYYIEASPLED